MTPEGRGGEWVGPSPRDGGRAVHPHDPQEVLAAESVGHETRRPATTPQEPPDVKCHHRPQHRNRTLLPSAPSTSSPAPITPSPGPRAQPREPSAQPRVPSAQPRVPSAQPREPSAQPRVPSAQPRKPSAQPPAPSAEQRGLEMSPRVRRGKRAELRGLEMSPRVRRGKRAEQRGLETSPRVRRVARGARRVARACVRRDAVLVRVIVARRGVERVSASPTPKPATRRC